MFRIGDYVAHYKEGVCEVVNIGKIDMGSSDKEYYTLKPRTGERKYLILERMK